MMEAFKACKKRAANAPTQINKMKNKKGSAIAYGLIIIAAVSILLVSVVQFIASQIRYASYVEVKERAFHIAEGGIYFYRWYLAHEIEGKNQQEIEDFWNNIPLGFGEGNSYVKDYLSNNYTKIGESLINADFSSPGDYNVIEVTSTGSTIERPDIARTVKATLRRSIWSDFAVISDGIVCFDKYWTINGKVMGNSGVHFNGVANNIVMAGVSSYDDDNPLHTTYNGKDGVWTEWAYDAGKGCYFNTEAGDSGECVFNAGTKFPVPKKDFTGVTAYMQAIRTEAREPGGVTENACTTTGCYFDDAAEGWRIILKSDDTFDVCPVDSYWTNNGTNHHYPKKYKKISASGTCNDCSGQCLANFTIPDKGVIFVEDNVWLEGTVSGKRVSIAAASVSDPATNANIFIMDDIQYTNFDGTDTLGILAEGDVEILKNTPNNLEIDGAILAQNGAVTKPEYNPNCCGGGCTDNKNYIDIFGCVITKNGLNFSLHKETCPNLEEARTITYDNNLYLYPPPFFPADSFYYVDLWEEM